MYYLFLYIDFDYIFACICFNFKMKIIRLNGLLSINPLLFSLWFVWTELAVPPTNMAISNIGPRSVTLQFKPGYDGKTSISRWQVEAQVRHVLLGL